MKIKGCFIALFCAMLFLPALIKGQAMNKRSDISGITWVPLKLNETGSNSIGKVLFFSQKGTCNSEEVLLLRVVNPNNYPVQVQWQIRPNGPVMQEVVPASTDVLGYCPSDKDKKQTALIITNIPQTAGEKEKAKAYFVSHLTVTELKN